MSEIREPLVVGDVIEASHGRRYHVMGFTRHGKTRLLREHTGTETAAWWRTRDDLPRGYRWAMWMGGGGSHV